MIANRIQTSISQFPPKQETDYRLSLSRRIIRVLRIGLGVGIVAIPAFVVNDLLFDPDALRDTFPTRLLLALGMAAGIACLSLPRIAQSPNAIGRVVFSLYICFSIGMVAIQAGFTNGFLISVPGYIQVMTFLPIVSFSTRHALGIFCGMFAVAVCGALIAGATQTETWNMINWLAASGAFALGATYVVDKLNRRAFLLERELAEEKERSDELLLNVLPVKIAERLKNKEPRIADHCPCATVLFADIAGFTTLSRGLEPGDLVDLLNDLFSRFDALAEANGVEKIKTIGDGYMAVAGLSETRTPAQAAAAVADLALAMRAAFIEFRTARGVDLALRIGVHSGPVIAGVIGARKFAFDLWGDTVNIASRVESGCLPDQIQITRETLDLIGPAYAVTARGDVELRGHDTRALFLLDHKIVG